ncbi:hypothetical protein DH2020_049386 [Rehmannia glutinosa]|uniref:Protein kinase domain-containing protein n=1 Tax=Rehmannia glutinosa TaxID=99300 RepID=A0ABR0U300_REHGL
MGETKKILLGKYEMGRLLGKGNFAKVYHGRNLGTNECVAIKVIKKDEVITNQKMMEQIKREISIMRLVRHPNIVELKEVMATRSKIFVVMEYVRGGALFSKVARGGRLKEDAARKYFQQLISAVDFCHSRGVFHRDLKPENLLLDENGDLKISDFGLSALYENLSNDGLFHTQCGTPAYIAPEVLRMKGYDGAKADIWSCGVVLYVLLAGFLPFQDENLIAMCKKIFRAEYEFPQWFSNESKRLISKLLISNPGKRISIPGLTVEHVQDQRKAGSTFTSRCSARATLGKIEMVGKMFGFKVARMKDFKLRLLGSTEAVKGRCRPPRGCSRWRRRLPWWSFRNFPGDTLEYIKFREEDIRPRH